VTIEPNVDHLTLPDEMIALNLVGSNRRLTEDLVKNRFVRFILFVCRQSALSVNIFFANAAIIPSFSQTEHTLPTLQEMKLPEIFLKSPRKRRVWCSSPAQRVPANRPRLAALLNEVNENKSIHIITLEDPIEFVHPQKKATFNQREMGTDFDSFSSGLRAALRQAPRSFCRRNARSLDRGDWIERRRNRPFGREHAAHDRRRPND